jgi:hypothetical protein
MNQYDHTNIGTVLDTGFGTVIDKGIETVIDIVYGHPAAVSTDIVDEALTLAASATSVLIIDTTGAVHRNIGESAMVTDTPTRPSHVLAHLDDRRAPILLVRLPLCWLTAVTATELAALHPTSAIMIAVSDTHAAHVAATRLATVDTQLVHTTIDWRQRAAAVIGIRPWNIDLASLTVRPAPRPAVRVARAEMVAA